VNDLSESSPVKNEYGDDEKSTALREAASDFIVAEDYASAVPPLRELVKLGAAETNDLVWLANVLKELDQNEEAVRWFSEVIDSRPDQLVARGLCFEALGDGEAARTDYEKALLLDPDDVVALVNLGTLALTEGDLDEAEQLLRRGVVLDPTVNWQLSDVFEARGDEAAARRTLQVALEAGERKANYELGILAVGDGDEAAAEHHLREALDAGGVSMARRSLAILLLKQGRIDEARDLTQEGVDAGDLWSHAPLALALSLLGQDYEAQKNFALAESKGDDDFAEEYDAWPFDS